MTKFYLDKDFENAIAKATEAGNQAGEKWLNERIAGKYTLVGNRLVDKNGVVVNPMLDVCGGAYVELKDKRTKFAKWLKRISNQPQIWSVPVNHKFGGWQDMGLKEAIIGAAYDVLTKEFGIEGLRFKSYID